MVQRLHYSVAMATALDRTRAIEFAAGAGQETLAIVWSDGTRTTLDMSPLLDSDIALAALREPGELARVRVGDQGHSLSWPSGAAISADRLWREALSAAGDGGSRAFLAWRLRHGLSLSGAAEALGLSRRMVAYYSNGEKPVPRTVQLACRGWEAEHRGARKRKPARRSPG